MEAVRVVDRRCRQLLETRYVFFVVSWQSATDAR